MSKTKAKVNNRSHTFSVDGAYSRQTGPVCLFETQPTLFKTIGLQDTVVYGDNIPNWRQKLANGEGVVTSMEGFKYTLKGNTGGSSSYRMNDPRYCFAGTSQGSVGISAFDLQKPTTSISYTADQQARSNFLSSYIKATNTFRGGNFAAEIKDSIELVLHPVRSMYSHTWEFARNVKKLGRVYQRNEHTAASLLSELWLAFSFGLKPAVNDANDAARALNELSMSNRHDLRKVVGTGFEHVLRSRGTSFLAEPGMGVACISYNKMDTEKLSVRYKGALKARPVGMGNLLNEFGIGVFDVVPAVWEGIPWSFFVDYFANVGEVLDSMRLLSAEWSWLIRTVRNSRTVTTSAFIDPPSAPSYSVQLSGGRFTGTGSYVSRQPSSTPYPDFQFKLPGTSPMRLLNIVSLGGVINDSRWGSGRAPKSRRPARLPLI